MKKICISLLFLIAVVGSVSAQTTKVVFDTQDGSSVALMLIGAQASVGSETIYSGKWFGDAPGTYVFRNGNHTVRAEWPYGINMKIRAQGGTQYWSLRKTKLLRTIVGSTFAMGAPLVGSWVVDSIVDEPGKYALICGAGILIGLPLIITSLPGARLVRVE